MKHVLRFQSCLIDHVWLMKKNNNTVKTNDPTRLVRLDYHLSLPIAYASVIPTSLQRISITYLIPILCNQLKNNPSFVLAYKPPPITMPPLSSYINPAASNSCFCFKILVF
ncbi:hypothetical protein L1987_32345 [Smallanthus sonchifolius]|uniref:Uncharacterized protein n=1 Tax=Smallanthus sonchifolius TaxID=185202 RepID=A0ACB9I7X3_9ASTR|nr:hypothetical protein L1987_32345 [Smallanthus sonchifolius]